MAEVVVSRRTSIQLSVQPNGNHIFVGEPHEVSGRII